MHLHKNRFHKLTWPKKIQKRNQNSMWIWIFLWWASTIKSFLISEASWRAFGCFVNIAIKILMLLCEIMTIFSWFLLKAVTPWLEEKLASKPDDTAIHQAHSHIQHFGYQPSPDPKRAVIVRIPIVVTTVVKSHLIIFRTDPKIFHRYRL